MPLSENDRTRYSRQILLEEIGEDGQNLLVESSALVIGCGALGGVIANNLVRAGVGHLIIVDRDVVELSNLQRQTLFQEKDIGNPKAMSAVEKLQKMNSDIEIEAHIEDIHSLNIEEFIKKRDIILDATDNMETRFLINDACVKHGIPWIYGGAIGTHGMTMAVVPGITACLRCIAPKLPLPGTLPTCDTVGVLNSITTIIGSIQSNEALRILTGKPAANTLISVDVWNHEYKQWEIEKNEHCRCCNHRDFEYLDSGKTDMVTTLCGSNSVQITPVAGSGFSFKDLSERLKRFDGTEVNDIFIKFRSDGYQLTIFANGRTIIKGTTDLNLAKSLFAKYIGK